MHPAPPAMISDERGHLPTFRAFVATHCCGLPRSATVDPTESTAITEAMDRKDPGYPPVASLPTLQDENVEPVAR